MNFSSRPTVDVNHSTRPGQPGEALTEDLWWPHYFVTAMNALSSKSVGAVGGWQVPSALWWFSVVGWTSSQDNMILFDFFLVPGTWRMEWYSDKRNDYGMQQAVVIPPGSSSYTAIPDISGSTTIDHYASARTRGIWTADFTVAQGQRGTWALGRRCIGKNAASSNYLMTFSALSVQRLS